MKFVKGLQTQFEACVVHFLREYFVHVLSSMKRSHQCQQVYGNSNSRFRVIFLG